MSTVVADPWKLLLQDVVFELMEDVKELKAEAPCDDSFELGR